MHTHTHRERHTMYNELRLFTPSYLQQTSKIQIRVWLQLKNLIIKIIMSECTILRQHVIL